jgi:hypothetical protein
MQDTPVGLDPHFVALLPFFLFFVAVATVVAVIPYWMIFKKAGFSPWLSLLFFVPVANIIILYVVAFSEWKVVPVAQLQPGYPPPYPPAPRSPVPPAASPLPPDEPYPRV